MVIKKMNVAVMSGNKGSLAGKRKRTRVPGQRERFKIIYFARIGFLDGVFW